MNTVISYITVKLEVVKVHKNLINKAKAKRRLIIWKIDDLIDELDVE